MNTEQNTFDPSLYDFLDDASIVKWVEEFVKRNQYFQTDYDELNRLAISKERKDHLELKELWESMSERYGFMPNVARIYLRPDVKMDTYGPVALPLQPVMAHEKVSKNVWSLMRPDGTRDERLMISVDLMYTDAEILSSLSDILWKKRKLMPSQTKRKRKGNWKLYLMVYDMKTLDPSLTYTNIGTILSKKGIVKGNEMKNMENYYKKAVALINGGYKHFLP